MADSNFAFCIISFSPGLIFGAGFIPAGLFTFILFRLFSCFFSGTFRIAMVQMSLKGRGRNRDGFFTLMADSDFLGFT